MEAEIESIEVVVRRKDGTSFTLEFAQGASYLEVETEYYEEPEYFYDLHPFTNTPTIRRVNLSVVRPRADLQTAAWDHTGKGAWVPHIHGVPLPGVVYTLREGNLDE